MDREEAIGLLRGGEKGVADWNWRRKSGESIPDFHGAEIYALRGIARYGADLRYADLHGATLQGANLVNADLGGAILWANLRGVNLRGADLSDADLSGAAQ